MPELLAAAENDKQIIPADTRSLGRVVQKAAFGATELYYEERRWDQDQIGTMLQPANQWYYLRKSEIDDDLEERIRHEDLATTTMDAINADIYKVLVRHYTRHSSTPFWISYRLEWFFWSNRVYTLTNFDNW